MKSFTTLATISGLASVAAASSAPYVTNNPIGASYYAQVKGGVADIVRGQLAFTSNPSGVGMKVSVNLAGLPYSQGPYTYSVRENLMTPNYDCSTAGAIFDPYNANAVYCDPSMPQTCDVGSLSAKHGAINSTSFVAAYSESYASLNPSSPAFIGDLSVVVADRNGSPLACANIACISPGNIYNGTAPYPTNGTTPTPPGWTTTPGAPTNTPPVPTSTTPPPPGNGATTLAVSTGAAFAAVMALFNLL